jgi:hypothetical protein
MLYFMPLLEFRNTPGLDLVAIGFLAFSTFDYLTLIIYFHGEEILYLPYSRTPRQVRLEID